ncbi:MAG: hypothetical protein ABI091_03325 [Ferruginibacter sp.]
MLQLIIREECKDNEEMVNVLKEIIYQIQQGVTDGYYPTWHLEGEEEDMDVPVNKNIETEILPEHITDEEIKKIVSNLISNGEKLKAVKLIKEKFGWGLLEAKNYCDAL